MKQNIALILLASLGVLAGCSQPEEKSEPAPEAKHDENIVTLTKENLQHVTLKTEPAALSSRSETKGRAR